MLDGERPCVRSESPQTRVHMCAYIRGTHIWRGLCAHVTLTYRQRHASDMIGRRERIANNSLSFRKHLEF